MKIAAALTFFALIGLSLTSCKKEVPERCTLQPDPGPCEAYIPKYYYDLDKKKCAEFIWGGCDGVIPFNTMKDCEDCIKAGNRKAECGFGETQQVRILELAFIH